MKKIYFAPQTDVVKLQIQQMIAATAVLDSTNTITDPDEVGARENTNFDLWEE